MITEKVNINGIEYAVSSSTYRGLVEAKERIWSEYKNHVV